MSAPTLRIGHLYPRRMNIYGDRGNIIALVRRAEWRGLTVRVDELEVGGRVRLTDYDLFFFGGGQDQEQETVAKDLKKRGAGLKAAVREGAALLAVCGGYQLLGRYYQPDQGDRLDGVGIFRAYTEAGPKRLIGNVVATPELDEIERTPLVGFENHSGLTYLAGDATPLARVRQGFGNNGEDGTEGCVSEGAVGTYLHGSLLPKNPHLADWLLERAVTRRRPGFGLAPLDDALETKANQAAETRFG